MRVSELTALLVRAKKEAKVKLFLHWSVITDLNTVCLNHKGKVLLSRYAFQPLNPPNGFVESHWSKFADVEALCKLLCYAVPDYEVEVYKGIQMNIVEVSLGDCDDNVVVGVVQLPPELHSIDYKDD